MTDEEATTFYEELKAHYGDKLVDPEVYPKIFEYQVRLYKYYRKTDHE